MDASLQNYFLRLLPKIQPRSIDAVLELHKEGATVPFIARYRKERTNNLDEVEIRAVIENFSDYEEIIKRKTFLQKEIGEQGNMTPEIHARIEQAWELSALEEIYRPFKKKKKTKATIARDAGLEPLADWIWKVGHGEAPEEPTMEQKAKDFLNLAAGIASYDLALKGAQDIVIEKVTNEPSLRSRVLDNYMRSGKIVSKRTKTFKTNSKYQNYAEHDESIKGLMDSKSSHRYLAMRRGWNDQEVSLEFVADDDVLQSEYNRFATSTPDTAVGNYLKFAAKQAYSVYILPSIANELHRVLKDKADADAIHVFSENVRKILLASPYGSKVVLGVDPGLRTGCKIALVDKSGRYISHTVLQILDAKAEELAKQLFTELLKQIKLEAVAVGNGTAGRQAETFLRKILKEIDPSVPVIMVSESGASVYSASEIAAKEFPDLDLTVRGAISIARRLQDPLAELVKVDPKSLGVGQYQHDVTESKLKKTLDTVVESCVNTVGVDLNTASAPLLSFVSGIGPSVAARIVEFREKKLFQDRNELMDIPQFSTKTFEQAAGFLRIVNGRSVLDRTGIHPERYSALREMAQEASVGVADLIGEGAQKLKPLREKWGKIIGQFTFDDLISELEKPGRDPRDPFQVFTFREDIFELKDLKEGMICPGLVTNVTNFGAFVDIGVHQDGLVHISELSHSFVADPKTVVSPGDQVKVKILGIDLEKKQLALSMKLEARPAMAPRPPRAPRAEGDRPPLAARGPRRGPPARDGIPAGGGGGGAIESRGDRRPQFSRDDRGRSGSEQRRDRPQTPPPPRDASSVDHVNAAPVAEVAQPVVPAKPVFLKPIVKRDPRRPGNLTPAKPPRPARSGERSFGGPPSSSAAGPRSAGGGSGSGAARGGDSRRDHRDTRDHQSGAHQKGPPPRRDDKPRAPANAFNNPFAALLGNKDNKPS